MVKYKLSFFVSSFIIVVSFNLIHCLESKEYPRYYNGYFNKPIGEKVINNYPKVFSFTYEFHLKQTWAIYVCVHSDEASDDAPLLVSVRQSLFILSWDVPVEFKIKSAKHPEICHTLCPLDNFFEANVTSGKQTFYVSISTQSLQSVPFTLTVSNFTDFLIQTEKPINLNVTTTGPKVLEYHIPEEYTTARIEVTSEENSCMTVAIQDIRCPFHDLERSVEYKGFYQTMTKKAAITINERFFEENKVYIVMVLRDKDVRCLGRKNKNATQSRERTKEVKVNVKSSISDKQFNIAVYSMVGIILIPYMVSVILFVIFYREKYIREFLRIVNEVSHVNVTEESTYGPINQPSTSRSGLIEVINNEDSKADQHNSENRAVKHMASMTDEIEIAEKCPEQVNQIYLSDIYINLKDLSKRSYIYLWNTVTTACIFGLPVAELVSYNQKIINMTGKQDLCYYNFMCSYAYGFLSDFNHVFSNLGYIAFGILFMIWTAVREHRLKKLIKKNFGVPCYNGLWYAMAAALFMEGVLSSCYHVCPTETNFQFDTAFMFVISILCCLKLYESRHPHKVPHSQHLWAFVAVLYFLNWLGTMVDGYIFRCIFLLGHIFFVMFMSAHAFYMGRKYSLTPEKRVLPNPGWKCGCFFITEHRARIFFFYFTTLGNIVYGILEAAMIMHNFSTFLLYIGIGNLAIYLLYYMTLKKVHAESIWRPAALLCISLLFWIFAIFFFTHHRAEWGTTPALSREFNAPCHPSWNFYDDHDIWHFLSSFALLFTYFAIFVMDIDQEKKLRTEIVIF